MKYFLHISYNGSRYHGWQAQAQVPSVQESLREAVSKLMGRDTSVMGCGRTDAQVHAAQYFAHIRTDKVVNENFCYKLNRILPKDIIIHELIQVPDNAHVQKNAILRQYDYHIHYKRNAFKTNLSAFYVLKEFDFDIIQNIAGKIEGQFDMRAFCSQVNDHSSTICTIYGISIVHSIENNSLIIRFQADRFLRSMVRILVFCLLELGKGRLNEETFFKSLYKGKKLNSIRLAHPSGLYLTKVNYSYLDRPVLVNPIDWINSI